MYFGSLMIDWLKSGSGCSILGLIQDWVFLRRPARIITYQCCFHSSTNHTAEKSLTYH